MKISFPSKENVVKYSSWFEFYSIILFSGTVAAFPATAFAMAIFESPNPLFIMLFVSAAIMIAMLGFDQDLQRRKAQ